MLTARFWGVRGSIACPGPKYHKYGGNTSCIEVRAGPNLVILDGGTGIRELGVSLRGGGPYDADILLTHTHFDHIVGIPFFGPLFDPKSRWTLYSGHLQPHRQLLPVLEEFMADPVFPVPPSIFLANVRYVDFTAGEVLPLRPGLEVRTALLNHPQRATAYRLTWEGASLCYVTDTEHKKGERDRNVVDLCRGADAMIYDCTYTDEEFDRYVGWGHSTWQEAVRLADEAGVRQLYVFHHDPSRDDDAMDRIAEAADVRDAPGTIAARDGMLIQIG